MAAGASLPSPQLLAEYSQFFRLLSEPARLQLLCQLRQGPMDVAALIEATGFSQSHISRQLGCSSTIERTILDVDLNLFERILTSSNACLGRGGYR